MVWSLAFSPDGRRLAIGQQGIDRPESFLRLWDLGKHTETVGSTQPAGVRSVAFSSDGQALAAALFDGTLLTLAIGEESKIAQSENQGAPINSLTFLPKSRIIAAGDWDGWVRFHGPDTIANRQPLKYPNKIWAMAISPDGSTLAVGGDATNIDVYDLATRQLKAQLGSLGPGVKSLAFSPDGRLLAASGGSTLALWNTATWQPASGPIQHHPEILCVKFSPDGKLLAISDGEHNLPHYNVLPTQIVLWDVASQTEVRRLRGHTNSIWALAFSPDSKTLASGSVDQTVKFWDTASGELRETIVPGESGTSAGTGAVRESGAGPK